MNTIFESIVFGIMILCIMILIIAIFIYCIKMARIARVINIAVTMPITSKMTNGKLSIRYLFCKRVFDIIISIIALMLYSPMIFMVGVLLKVTGTKQIFMLNSIVGYKKKKIKIYQFNICKENLANMEIKRIIYQSGIDRLPMYFSILKGELSLIGLEKIQYTNNMDKELLKTYQYYKPGLVSLSDVYKDQISDIELNRKYIANAGIKLDIAIWLYVVKDIIIV